MPYKDKNAYREYIRAYMRRRRDTKRPRIFGAAVPASSVVAGHSVVSGHIREVSYDYSDSQLS